MSFYNQFIVVRIITKSYNSQSIAVLFFSFLPPFLSLSFISPFIYLWKKWVICSVEFPHSGFDWLFPQGSLNYHPLFKNMSIIFKNSLQNMCYWLSGNGFYLCFLVLSFLISDLSALHSPICCGKRKSMSYSLGGVDFFIVSMLKIYYMELCFGYSHHTSFHNDSRCYTNLHTDQFKNNVLKN